MGSTEDFKGEEGWGKILAHVLENLSDKAAYIISEFRFTSTDGRDQNKLIMLSWCPENKIKKVKVKMLHGSTLGATKQAFEGIQGKPITANNFSELEFDEVLSECR